MGEPGPVDVRLAGASDGTAVAALRALSTAEWHGADDDGYEARFPATTLLLTELDT